MRYTKILTLLLCVISLSACQTLVALQDDLSDLKARNLQTAKIVGGESEILLESPCPKVKIIDDLSSLSDFSNPDKATKQNLISRVDLKGTESTCHLGSKSVIVDLKLIFYGQLGAKGRLKPTDKPFFSYPYFIAITDPSGKIMAKEIFAASLTYGSNEHKHEYFEKLRQIIPIKNKSIANYYKVLVGFQATPDQLAYNRENLILATEAAKKLKLEIAQAAKEAEIKEEVDEENEKPAIAETAQNKK